MRSHKVPMDVERGAFPCRVCEHVFETGEDFSNHFARISGSAFITGCKLNPTDVKKLRVPVEA